ncbi:MAG: DNA-binding domain-containing protein [Cocleimonas sp.]
MSELHRLQKDMMAWLQQKDARIKPDIVDTGEVSKVSVDQRLAVYGNAYGYRLIDALSENYPAVHTLMGDDDFYEMSYAYMAANPSSHFSLRYFGHHLETFLLGYDKGLPIYTEMARFEWALRNSFDSKNITTLTLESLQAVPVERWGDLQFKFHPSVSRIDLEWNTPQLWSAIEEGADPIAPEKLEHAYAWLLWRKDLLNYYRSLDVDEAYSLDSAMQGGTFSNLCEGVCEWIDEEHAPARVAGFVSQWIDDDLLVDMHF